MITWSQIHFTMGWVQNEAIERGVGSSDTIYAGMIEAVAVCIYKLAQPSVPPCVLLMVGYNQLLLFQVAGLTPSAYLSTALPYFKDEGTLNKWWGRGEA